MDPWAVVLAVTLGPGAIVAVVALLRGYTMDVRLRMHRNLSLWDWLKAERADMRAIDELKARGQGETPPAAETPPEPPLEP